MDADEKMRLHAAGNRDAPAQTDEMVGIAREHGLHAGFSGNKLGKPPCDLKNDDFFLRFAPPDGTGVFAPVSRVDDDDDLIFVLSLFGRSALRRRLRVFGGGLGGFLIVFAFRGGKRRPRLRRIRIGKTREHVGERIFGIR